MDNVTLTAETDFFQSINYDHDARRAELETEQAYRDVWLYDRDDEARKRVEANTNAAMYALPSMQDKKGMALWGREQSKLAAPQLADTPVELAQNMRDRLVDDGMKERYTAQMATLEASGQDSADDWYSLYAEMNRDVVQKAWDDHQARVKAVEASLAKVYEYASGADMGQEEGAALTQEDADNMRSVLADGKMAELDDMRAFSRVYLRKLEQIEDGEAIIRGLDDLEDELLDIVGQDEEKAEMMYRVIMDWGQRVADSDKVSVGDEFLLSLGNKLRTWEQPRTQAMFATTPAVGAAGAINVGTLSSAAAQIQEAGKEGQDKALARGILRAGAQKAREVGENTGWVKGALRAAVGMAADTSTFLVPGLGMALGPMDLAASSITDTYDMARASGESRFGAGVQAAIGAAVGPAVELLPFGKIGGVGLSRFTKYLTQVAPGTGSKVGALARAVGRWQHKNAWRALGAEAGAGFVGEALVEPIASGVASYGLEQAIYALGSPEGEQSRAFAQHFEELAAIWTDPTQLAGLALFTAALTGGSYRGIKANVKNRNVLFASGLTEEQVEQVMESDRPVETANSILAREMETDPEGLWKRRAKQSQQLKAEGKVLFLTGAVAQAEVPELQLAYAAAWQEFTDKGILPSVTENEDGTFHVVQKGRYGEKDLDMTLTADAADAFVADAIRQLEDRELKLRQQKLGKKAEMPNLRGALQENVATIAGEAMARRTQEQGRFNMEDVAKQVPESIGRMIRANGSINRTIAERITDWAQGEIQALVAGGMDYKAAAASRDYAAGAVRSLGDWTSFAAGFTERAGQVGDVDTLGTTLFRSQTSDEVLVDGARVLGSALFGVRGRMSGLNVLEDVTESVLDQMVQARAVHMVELDSTMSRQEAEGKAWDELGEVVSRARAAVLKADPKAKVVAVKPGNKLSVIEAFSDISNSAFLTSGVVPKWMGPMAETMKANVTAANAAMTLAEAWNAAIEQDPNAVAAMRDILDKVGVEVGEVLADTSITATDVEAWKTARAVARADAYGPNGSGGDAVSEVLAEAEAEEAAILEAEKPASKEYVEEAKEEVRQQEEHAEQVFQPEPGAQIEEPKEVQGVFVGGYCVYNAAGGYYMGLVDKSQLRDGIEQVKVGAKGKHGVIAGRELVGNFQSSAAPLYVWKRTSGELWLISGRLRFELMLRDNGVKSHPCYVFVEDAEHDEKWARMMDYENNMRDDQADEVTAAMYVRETGYSDAELLKRGLLRNASRSKRGALIGRHAREELWTRFTNGAIKPMDAEIICNLTKNIKDQSRVEEIQRRCCMLLADGKSWDFIGGMVQLMANKESITLKQGLLNLGADFEADLARAAAWIEKSLGKIKESISLLKQGRKLSGKKREEAERLGIVTATQEGAEEMLRDLEMLRGKYEMIGSYPDLVAQAQMWDGKTDVDPVGLYLERVQAEREQARAEGELDADAYLAEQARKAAAEAVPTLSFSMGEALDVFFEGAPGENGVQDVPVELLMMQKVESAKSVRNAWRYMNEAEGGGRAKRKPVAVVDNRDGTYTIVDGNATSLALAAHGAQKVRVQVVGEDAGSRLNNSAYLIQEETPGADADKRLRTHGLDGLHGDVAMQRAFEQAEENIPLLEGLVQVAAGKVGGEVMMRPANDENGLATKKPSTARDKANRDYQGDISRVVDLIGGTCVMTADGDFTDAIKAIRQALNNPEYNGASIAKVKKLGFNTLAPQYRDVKVSVRFANGGIGEIILVQDVINDAKFNRGGHLLYDVTRELEPYNATDKKAHDAYRALEELSALVYQASSKVTSDAFVRAKSNASSALEALKSDSQNLSLSSFVATAVKSSDSLLKKVKPASVVSAAMPRRSLIQNISKDMIGVSVPNVNNNLSLSMISMTPDIAFSMGKERNLAAVHSLSPEKFLAALELGGMPMPSVAVTRLDKPYSWGGADAINLVGRPEMVDPKEGTEVYSRDAWTGNFPRVEHKVIGKKDRSESVTDLFQLRKKYQNEGDYNSAIHQLNYRINMDYGGEQTGRSDMDYALRQRTGKALFAWQSGYQPRPKMKDAVRTHEWLTKEFAAKLREYTKLTPDEYHEKWREIKEEVRQEIEKVYRESSVIKKAPTSEAAEKRLSSWVNVALRAFDAYSPSALAKELDDVKKIDARVLDIEANLDMLAKYADKHKKAYEAWIEQKLNTWFSKESYIHGTKREATLDNLTEYMLGRKARGEEKGLAFSSGLVRAHQAERLYSLEGIKERREMLTDSGSSKEMKEVTNGYMEDWREGGAAILNRGMSGNGFTVRDDLMETLAKVKGEPTAEKLRAAVRKMFRGADSLQQLLNNAEVIGYGVEALKSLRAELEDYMEAVPQRAVKMDEWEYAVMPASLKKNKAVMDGLRENGIRPRFHDGTEEGRRAALSGLVNDSRVSFSVVGENAANWDEIKHLAFRGRDDGKLRVELDASQARLREAEFEGKAHRVFRYLLNAVNMKTLSAADNDALLAYAAAYKDFKQKEYKTIVEAQVGEDELREVRDASAKARALREAAYQVLFRFFKQYGVWLEIKKTENEYHNPNAVLDVLVADYAEGRVSEQSRKLLDEIVGTIEPNVLGEMLDFPELYKAYPMLKKIEVNVRDLGRWTYGQVDRGWGRDVIVLNSQLLPDMEQLRSTLLHEVQHVIQGIEEFAAGGNEESARAKYTKLTNSYYRERDLHNTVAILRWLNGREEAKVKLDEYRKAMNDGADRGELERLREEYNIVVSELNDGYSVKDPVYMLGYKKSVYAEELELPSLGGVEPMWLEILDKVWAEDKKSRKKAFPGLEKKMKAKLKRLNNEVEADAKLALKLEGKSDYELYKRLAGEIESRNVQLRRDWTAEERRARPFNETLEYPGEALVSFSMSEVAQNALLLLESRRDEVEAQVILEDMQKACERLSIVLAVNDDPKLGAGLQVYAEMQALISATRRALPAKYLRQGNLNGLLAWAGVYARMAQTGQMPKRGAIKGEIYDRFVRELSRKNELMQLQGMSEAEAREVLMDLGTGKLETAFLKVGRDCAQRLDAFLKDRALERINWLYKMAYPKREEGQAWTRGKMASDAYRLVEKVMAIIGRSHEQRAKVDEEIREVRREQRKIRQAMESGQMTEDMGKRKLDVLRGRIDRLEAEAMATAADEHAKRLEELNRQIEELEDGEQKEAQESILAEEMALVQTFGNWYYKGAGDAVRAARVFEDIVLRGKTDWEDKLKLERERRAYLKAMIAANFDVADEDVENVRAGDRAAFKGKMGSKVKALGKGLMSMGHLLLALRPKMGRAFCDEQRAKLARINEGFMAFNMELDGWMYRTIRNITGIDSKERQKVWMNQMEEIKDTGIFITNRRTEKIVLTYAEAVAWLNMDKESRAKERERVMTEAAQEKRKPQNVPTEEVMDELGELVQAYEKDKRGVEEDRKKFHLTHEVTWEEELRTTKGVLLFYLLTFEQPDYEHLMEVNGVSGATLDKMRRYIGPQMMKWGYAMREKLNEHGVLVADAFEAYTGIPFGSRELYFKGVFDRGPMKERDEKAAVEQGSAAAGTRTKYGSLIPRRYHKAKVERVSATQVFVQAMQQQNNYVQTAEYVREWRGLLSDKDFAKRLEAELGAATMQILNGWIGVLEGAAAGDAAAARAATGIINKMLGGYTVSRLAGNIKTLIKQASAILNGFAGGYVPDKLVENGQLVQELAYRKIGFGEFMQSLGRVLLHRGEIKKAMVTGEAFIASRREYEGKGLAGTAMMEANQKVAGYVTEGGFLGWSKVPQEVWSWLGAKSQKATDKAMEAMGWVDSEMCAVSAMAIADAVYRQGKAEDKDGVIPDELLRAKALQVAGMALDIAAQPQVRTQKGYWAASGAFGAMGQFLYMFRSDTLQKVGLWGAQLVSGEKAPSLLSWAAFGVLNAVIAEVLTLLWGDVPDDEDEAGKHALTFLLNVLLNDVGALPVVGETVGTLRNLIEGKHWAASGGIGEAVVPVVTLGSDVYREWKNIEKGAAMDKHWAAIARLLRSLGSSAAFFHENTTGALANMSSVAAAAAVAGNASTLFKGILKAIEDMKD